MGAIILRRLLAIPPLLLVVSILVFGMMALMPGDPAYAILGEQATPERVALLHQQMHLDENVVVRYGSWLSNVVRGDLGTSYASRRAISGEIRQRLPVTASVAFAAFVVALLIGVPGGILGGILQKRWIDRLSSFGTSIGLSIPNYWLGTVLVAFFAVTLKWLPSVGYVDPTQNFPEWVRRLILPSLTLGLVPGAELARQLRSGLITVSRQDYIRTAWAKGLSARAVIGKHALKNAATPAITIFGMRIGYLLAGAAIVEDIFGIPGMGKYTLQAIMNRDVPDIQAVVLVSSLIVVLANLTVDVINAILTPRARVQ